MNDYAIWTVKNTDTGEVIWTSKKSRAVPEVIVDNGSYRDLFLEALKAEGMELTPEGHNRCSIVVAGADGGVRFIGSCHGVQAMPDTLHTSKTKAARAKKTASKPKKAPVKKAKPAPKKAAKKTKKKA